MWLVLDTNLWIVVSSKQLFTSANSLKIGSGGKFAEMCMELVCVGDDG